MEQYDLLHRDELEDPNNSKGTALDKASERLGDGMEKTLQSISSWSIWGTVKEKSTEAFTEAKADLESMTKDFSKYLNTDEKKEDMEGSTETVTARSAEVTESASTGDNSKPQSMFAMLSSKAQDYIDGLDRDLEKVETVAGSFLKDVGQDARYLLKELVTVDAPAGQERPFDEDEGEDLPNEVLFNVPADIRSQIYSTRLQAQLHALHNSPDVFRTAPENEQDYNKFAEQFDADVQSDQIQKDLDESPKLKQIMEELVPTSLSYAEFWTKYYYMKNEINEQERRRKDLLANVSKNEEEVDWSDDDEDEVEIGNAQEGQATKKSSTRPSSEESYDLVSKRTTPTPTPAPTDAESKAEDNDDDDDWA